MKKKYILAFYKPFMPPVDFPICIKRKGVFGYRYQLMHDAFYATRLNLFQALWHMLSFKLLTPAARLRRFQYRKVWGKLVVEEIVG